MSGRYLDATVPVRAPQAQSRQTIDIFGIAVYDILAKRAKIAAGELADRHFGRCAGTDALSSTDCSVWLSYGFLVVLWLLSYGYMADRLVDYYQRPDDYQAGFVGMSVLLEEASEEIAAWGRWHGERFDPRGGCAGVVALIEGEEVCIFQTADCEAWMLDRKKTWVPLCPLVENTHVLSNYFGVPWKKGFQIHSEFSSFQPGTRLLLFSDGLAKYGARPKVLDAAAELDVVGAIRRLHGVTCRNGAPDDWTVLVVDA